MPEPSNDRVIHRFKLVDPGDDDVAILIGMNEPLVISQDETLLSLVQSSAAAGGIDVRVCDSGPQIRRLWGGAGLVVVGVDKAATVAGLGLPERAGVHIAGMDADAVLAWSVPLGAPGLVLPRQSGFLSSLLDEANRPGSAAGSVLRLFGASGGLGTSTLALGLAVRAARRGRRAAVVELDPAGGGLDVMAGVERDAGWRWGDLAAARGHVDDLTGHLPSVLGVDILASSRAQSGKPVPPEFDIEGEAIYNKAVVDAGPSVAPPEAVAAVLASLRRTHDLVVVDHGHVPPAHEETVLVVGADVRSVLSAQVILANGLATTHAVVRSGPGRRLPPDLIAESLGLTVSGVFPHDGRLPGAQEAGDPPGRARGRSSRALDHLLDRLAPDPKQRRSRGPAFGRMTGGGGRMTDGRR